MNNIVSYDIFESNFNFRRKLSESVAIGADVWKRLDQTADEIMEHGYGKPIRDLIASEPMFAVEKYGKQLCEPDVLDDRWHQLRKKNRVLRTVSFPEQMTMLLTHWRGYSGEDGFNGSYNPKKLPFSKWVMEPQTLYRGMPEYTCEEVISKGVLDKQSFYSFSFLVDMAKLFTSPSYASGGFVPKNTLAGYVFSTQARPIDFHIFMGSSLSDEMEVILKSPVKVEVYGSINVKKPMGKDLTK